MIIHWTHAVVTEWKDLYFNVLSLSLCLCLSLSVSLSLWLSLYICLVWLPDGWFGDQLQWEVHAGSFKLYPDGTFFYSRHCILTLKQSQLDLTKYPLDSQYIDLKLMSYSYSLEQVAFVWQDPPVTYLKDQNDKVIFITPHNNKHDPFFKLN